jgi:hypothetical protein
MQKKEEVKYNERHLTGSLTKRIFWLCIFALVIYLCIK